MPTVQLLTATIVMTAMAPALPQRELPEQVSAVPVLLARVPQEPLTVRTALGPTTPTPATRVTVAAPLGPLMRSR